MAAKEDVSKPFGEDAGEILQLCDESNDEGHGEGTYEFDVDEMKSQLGIDDIVKSVAALTELVKRKVDNSADTEVGLKRAKLVAGSSFSNSSPPEGSEPSTSAVAKSFTTDTETAELGYILPSICEETEAFGPPVSDMIANIVNANCVTKPLEDKVKEIHSRYQTPRNCEFLGVPKVNKELWFDLSKPVRMKDLALQDVQKNIVKANQALVVTLERVIKAEDKKEKIDPSTILPQLSDMLNVLGNAIFLTSLKRRDELRPHINKSFQSVCSKSTKITTLLFGDDLAKQIKDISEVNKISRKVSCSSRDSRSSGSRTDGKTVTFSTRGKKGPFLGFRRGSSGGGRIPYSRPSSSSPSTSRTNKDKA